MNIVPTIPKEDLDKPAFDIPTDKSNQIDDSNIPDLGSESSKPTSEGASDADDLESRPRVQKRMDRLTWEREESRRTAQEATDRANRLEELLEKSLTTPRSSSSQDREVPAEWMEVLGDTPITKKFYELLDKDMSARERRAAEVAIQAYVEREQEGVQSVRTAERNIDNDREDLEDSLDRKLTDDEAASLLDIADEFTPTDEDGNYTRPLMPLSAAYEIYRSRTVANSNGNKQARNSIASIVDTRGGTVDSTKQPKIGRPNPDGWRGIFG